LNLEGLGYADWSFLEKLLTHTNGVRELNLNNNKLGRTGAQQVARLVCKFPCIQKLELASNGIGEEGLKLISSELSNAQSEIRSLDIRDNDV
jgi:Ran GTPase-activating protein (RanGAP) involved in mRNA processing and transport